MLTVADLKTALPPAMRGYATQELADKVNQLNLDPETADEVRNNIISYTVVLKEGRFKTEDYMSAVVYVSFKIMGYTNQEAYKRTFPQRYQALVSRGASDKDISAYVAAYNRNKLVNLILEQTLVPTYVLNQDIYQKAINTQAELMMYAKSEKVRSDAANSLLTHLKKPDVKGVELSIGIAENSGLSELKDTLTLLAQQQQNLIGQGMKTQTVAHQALVHTKPNQIKADVVDAEEVKEGEANG